MPTVSEREAVKLFGEAMTPYIENPPSVSMELFAAFARFHRDIRVEGAEDSVMLEWAIMTPHRLHGFTDIRVTNFTWESTEYQCLCLSRQLKSAQGDGDTALRVFAYFDPPSGDEPSSNIEFDGLDGLEAAFQQFVQVPYVAALLAKRPSRVTAFVGEVG